MLIEWARLSYNLQFNGCPKLSSNKAFITLEGLIST